MFVDSHAHLDDERFEPDLAEVIERAGQAGVDCVVSVGSGVAASERAIAIARMHPARIAVAVGVDPHSAAAADSRARDTLRELAGDRHVVAIGETGLDYHYELSPRDAQCEAFRFHLELALEAKLPVIVHCRDAFDDCFEMLAGPCARGLGGVAHCFTGTAAQARTFLELGFFISLAGMLTFKNAQNLRDVAAGVPLEQTLIETDSPLLAPHPKRGKRNEPSFLPFVAAALARAHDTTIEAIGRITSKNAQQLFKLGRARSQEAGSSL